MQESLLFPSHLHNLAFSYHENSFPDGDGSQLKRIYGIYALSRFLGVSYIHSPMREIFYQGLRALEKNHQDPELVSRYNQLFTIPSDREIPKHAKVHYLFRLKNDFSFLHALKEQLNKSHDFVLLKIGCPYFLVNQHPNMIHHVKAISPFKAIPSALFKIAIHVRRGDLLISPEKNRLLPNSYYINLSLQIINVLKALNIPFTCELHTEVPSKTFVVTPEHHSMKDRLEAPATMTPEGHAIEDFEVIPHLKKYINADPLASLRSLATADLVIMSRSAFSYLGAMLNKKGIIVYHPFWCATPLARIFHTDSAAACGSLMYTASVSNCSSGSMRHTVVVAIHRLPGLHKAARRLATNQYEISGLEWLDATHKPSFHERLLEACRQWKKQKESLWTI